MIQVAIETTIYDMLKYIMSHTGKGIDYAEQYVTESLDKVAQEIRDQETA